MSSSSHHHHEPAGAMWDLHTCSSISSAWAPPMLINYHHQHHHHHLNPNNANSTNSCEEEDVSTVESSSFLDTATCCNDLLPQHNPIDTHLWSHMLLSSDVGSNMVESISTKSMTTNRGVVLEPAACDYLKKFDSNNNNCWDIMDVHEKDWSIAPPQDPNPTNYKYNTKIEAGPTIRSLFNSNLHAAGGREDFADHHADKVTRSYYSSLVNDPASSCRNDSNIADVISFGSWLSKPLLGVDQPSRHHHFESTNNNVGKKSSQGLRNSMPASQAKGRGSAARNEGKRKRNDQESCSEMKKQKHTQKQNSTTVVPTSSKVAKVKLGDRIGNLQQIVSPFGKTDTASVLMEAIQYIKLLQEQVQLLVSNPYLKTNSFKLQDAWDRKDVKFDLTSRGFCLIPVSRAPQVCRENNTGSDYWTPPYRGMFYR